MNDIREELSQDQIEKIDSIKTSINRLKDDPKVDSDSLLEPDDYFKKLKESSNETTEKALIDSTAFIFSKIEKARAAGQVKLVNSFLFSLNTIQKELTLLTHGVNQFIHRSTVKEFIKKVTPTNSVKMIELSRYPRVIPDEILERVEYLQNQNLFDEFVVLFTDFTDEKYADPKEQHMINRNRDPILFGVFLNNELGFQHERMYIIGDWEDEFCNLTMQKFISKLPELQITNTHVVIENHQQILDSYASEYAKIKVESSNIFDQERIEDAPETKLTFKDRMKKISNLLFKW